MVSLQGICMEDERIKADKQWPKPKSVRDNQVFIRFANFYWQFIQGFNYIAAPLISMLKTTRSTWSTANPKETKDKVGCDSMVGNIVDSNEATNPTKRKN